VFQEEHYTCCYTCFVKQNMNFKETNKQINKLSRCCDFEFMCSRHTLAPSYHLREVIDVTILFKVFSNTIDSFILLSRINILVPVKLSRRINCYKYTCIISIMYFYDSIFDNTTLNFYIFSEPYNNKKLFLLHHNV
jgi:hypothetical protein